MGTQSAPIDPMERDLAAAQLDEITLANQERGWEAWKEVVLSWHLETVAAARAEAWIPGLARSQDPAIEEVLGRFYRHHLSATVVRESGAIDAGERAHSILINLRLYAGASATRSGPPH
jgi:hypothetical protein